MRETAIDVKKGHPLSGIKTCPSSEFLEPKAA
jgi:hypothetical protein